jgi:hypothetical protein
MKGTDIGVEGTDFAMKGTDIGVKGTDFATKGTDIGVEGTDFATKGTDIGVEGTDFAIRVRILVWRVLTALQIRGSGALTVAAIGGVRLFSVR